MHYIKAVRKAAIKRIQQREKAMDDKEVHRKITGLQAEQVAQNQKNIDGYCDLRNVIISFKRDRPNDRSELDRVYAVTITELEKALGYFYYAGRVRVDLDIEDKYYERQQEV
jgi:hypothetical protein